MKRRTAHLVGYTAGYVGLLLLERVQNQLELQAAVARARAERERAEAIAEAIVQAARVALLEEELQAAVNLEDVAAEHRCWGAECCPDPVAP